MAANRAEIDTSAPFRSVKEAVMLFGERVLAGEVYAHKLKAEKTSKYDHRVVASELEETKQSLQEARDETIQMARSLSTLQKELEQTKREIEKLKARGSNSETEDLKYVECATELTEQVKAETTVVVHANSGPHQSVDFQKKKCVSFANHLPVAHVAVAPSLPSGEAAVLGRNLSIKKKKKKHRIPFIAGFFSKEFT